MTDQPRKRISIDAPDAATILAARHLDATEGRVQIGAAVDSATRSAINQVLRYVSSAHNSPAVPVLPASTAPTAAAHPLVKGRCPACNGASLFLGSGGYVTCSRLDCPNPCAADDLMHRGKSTEPVTALYEQWVKAGPPPLGASMARWWDMRLAELRQALRPPAEQSARTTLNNPTTSKDQ